MPSTLQKIKLRCTGRSLSSPDPALSATHNDNQGISSPQHNRYSLFSKRRSKSTSPYYMFHDVNMAEINLKTTASMSSFTPLLRAKSQQHSPSSPSSSSYKQHNIYYSTPNIPSPRTAHNIPHSPRTTTDNNNNIPQTSLQTLSRSPRAGRVLRRQPRVRPVSVHHVSVQHVYPAPVWEPGTPGTALCTDTDCLPCSFLKPQLRGKHNSHIKPSHVRNFD